MFFVINKENKCVSFIHQSSLVSYLSSLSSSSELHFDVGPTHRVRLADRQIHLSSQVCTSIDLHQGIGYVPYETVNDYQPP